MNLNIKTVAELRKIAKEKGVSYTGLNKGQLIHYLTAPECAGEKKGCGAGRVCDLYNNKCVEKNFVKSNLIIEEIDGFEYAGLKKDLAKLYPILDRIREEARAPEIIIEPPAEGMVISGAPAASDYVARENLHLNEISDKINLFDRYNVEIYSIINA